MLTPDWNSPLKIFLGARLFPWALVVTGGLLLALALAGVLRRDDPIDWPTVPGTVLESAVDSHAVRTHPEGLAPPRTRWEAHVRYSYVVAGTGYSSDRVAMGAGEVASRREAEALVARYPAGRTVAVHYAPGAPAQSVLETGSAGPPWLPLLLGLLFCAAGGVSLVLLPRLAAG